ncbi:PdaC/SigV domain-containing protein [Peribacillus sp. B-H-3]|uniref:PdaC/SigV domain-containing protein n=1 Tax=Peribacillus sp. B-H-3 TaxID=3400420 RepID=UPI003B029007
MKIQKVLKTLLVLSLFVSLLFTANGANAASPKTAYVNTQTTLNVRSAPNTKAKIVGSLSSGATVNVYAKLNSGWSEIFYKNKKAYVSTRYLKFYTTIKVTKHTYKGLSDLSYAQVSGMKNKTAEKKINQILLNEAQRSYKSYLAIQADEKRDKGETWCTEFTCDYEYITSYKVKYNDGERLSLLVYDYTYEGGAHGMSYAEGFNFNSSGSRVKISNILTSKAKMEKVRTYAYNYLSKHEPTRDFVQKRSDVPMNSNSQFYFAHGGIYLIYQEYDVAAYAAGNPVLKIPSSIYN